MYEKYDEILKLVTESSSLSDLDYTLGYLKEEILDKTIKYEDGKILYNKICEKKLSFNQSINEVVAYRTQGDDLILVAPTEENRNFGENITYFKLFNTKLSKKQSIDFKHDPCWRISILNADYIHHAPEYPRGLNGKEKEHLNEILNNTFYNCTYDEDYDAILKTYIRAMNKKYREQHSLLRADPEKVTMWNALIYKINRANHFSTIINILQAQPDYKDIPDNYKQKK